jgi:hypothetical protein
MIHIIDILPSIATIGMLITMCLLVKKIEQFLMESERE